MKQQISIIGKVVGLTKIKEAILEHNRFSRVIGKHKPKLIDLVHNMKNFKVGQIVRMKKVAKFRYSRFHSKDNDEEKAQYAELKESYDAREVAKKL